jgi:hypothetical protein
MSIGCDSSKCLLGLELETKNLYRYVCEICHSESMSRATSPASTGPAGGYFEGQVGASFLLSLLVGGEPRGLPGTLIDRVAFQRAAEGHPLDDVIVYAHNTHGESASLEVQVNKGITFAPTDPISVQS